MKLSVLLPTRGGAEYLPRCIESVLSQDADLELVVANNANSDGTSEILRGQSDPRLRVVNHLTPVSVTDNWASALDASTGDFVLMMGDDDLLLQGSAQRIETLLQETARPECLLFNGYSYVAPQSFPGIETSQYADPHFHYDLEFEPYSDIPRRLRTDIVRAMFRFRPRIPLNMQTTVFAKAAVWKVRGGFFPAPFPDHYALNSMLLTADRWVYVPEKLVVVGVTPKSFGHHVYGESGDAGLTYLGVSVSAEGGIPGSPLIDGMRIWLQLLLVSYPDMLQGVHVSRGDYVLRQMWAGASSVRSTRRVSDLAPLIRALSPTDVWLAIAAAVRQPDLVEKAARRLRLRRGAADRLWTGLRPLPEVADIGEFSDWLAATGRPG